VLRLHVATSNKEVIRLHSSRRSHDDWRHGS